MRKVSNNVIDPETSLIFQDDQMSLNLLICNSIRFYLEISNNK